MPGTQLRERYLDQLLDNVRQTEYPSRELMNRIEAALHSQEKAEEYVEVLLTKVQHMAPSLQLLDRIHRMVSAIELNEQLSS